MTNILSSRTRDGAGVCVEVAGRCWGGGGVRNDREDTMLNSISNDKSY